MPRSVYWPVRHRSRRLRAQDAQGGEHARRTIGATQSPGSRPATFAPTATTCPSASWPSTRWRSPGGGCPNRNSARSRSVPHTPVARTRNSTWSGSGGSGSGMIEVVQRVRFVVEGNRAHASLPYPLGNQDQREAGPGQDRIEPAPQPDGFVEESSRTPCRRASCG